MNGNNIGIKTLLEEQPQTKPKRGFYWWAGFICTWTVGGLMLGATIYWLVRPLFL